MGEEEGPGCEGRRPGAPTLVPVSPSPPSRLLVWCFFFLCFQCFFCEGDSDFHSASVKEWLFGGMSSARLGAPILGCWFLTHLNYFWRVTWGLLAFRSPGFGGLGFGVWIWVSGFRGVWGLVLHRRLRWFARGLLARRRTTPKGDSPGGGYSPGGGHSTTDVQSKAVDQNQEEKFSPPGAGALCLKAKSSFSGRGHPFNPRSQKNQDSQTKVKVKSRGLPISSAQLGTPEAAIA